MAQNTEDEMSRAITIMGMGGSATGKLEIIGECWSLNNAYNRFPGLEFDRMYDIHDIELARRTVPNKQGHDHFTRLDMLNCPVYMQSSVPQIQQSRPYPLDAIACHFRTNYFIGSPSYMLAHALYEGVRHIRVYGIDQSDELHKQQRQAWTFWLAKAQTMGVRVDGSHNWLNEWDVDGEGLQNAYRNSAIPALKAAVDAKKISGTVFVCDPRCKPQAKPPAQVPIEEQKQGEMTCQEQQSHSVDSISSGSRTAQPIQSTGTQTGSASPAATTTRQPLP
jgi:hypothetical protein